MYDNSIIKSGWAGHKLRLPIFYIEMEISYLKGKSWIKIDTWAVSVINDQYRLLKDDSKTRSRLNDKFYGSKYKGQRGIRIERFNSCREVGKTVW